MLKKAIVTICIGFASQLAFADRCPSIQDIKHHAIKGWKICDSEDGTPLSQRRMQTFVENVERFAMAEWESNGHQGGTIHCYYIDHNGSNLEAFLTKPNFMPEKTAKPYWYEVSGYTQCAVSADKCAFKSLQLPNKNQFARR